MIVASRTPPAVIDRLHDEVLKAVARPDVKERLAQLGADPFPMAPEAFNAYIKSEMDSAARIAKAANLQGQ
jgi:tripartite-type tricarboxylate transporter receptor subunit TctC